MLPAKGQDAQGFSGDFCFGCIFHAQLDPAATAFESHAGRIEVGIAVSVMGDEL